MARQKKSDPSWTNVKKAIEAHGPDEAIKLVGDLYRFSKANQDFIHTRYSIGSDTLKPYKKIIDDSIYPDMYSNKPLRISRAKAAVADYKKAVGDPIGETELLIYFAESGNEVATSYGDMDWPFYSAVIDAYQAAIKNVKALPEASLGPFKERLEKIMLTSKKAAGGYQDRILELYEDAFVLDDLDEGE
jgi:hypothetical protein